MTDETITIKVGKHSRDIKVPSSWNDLDTRTLMLFYETLFTAPGDEFTGTAFTSVKLLGMLQQMLKVDMQFISMWEAQRKRENPEAGEAAFLDELRQTLHFALAGLFDIETKEEGGTSYAAKLNLTANPWPILTGPGKTKRQAKRHYYAPKDELDNVTIYEMGMAFSYFEAYLKTNKEEHAHHLLALLYRPTRPTSKKETESAWGGDRRQPLRGYEGKIEERVKLVKTMPPLVQRVLLFWFAGCRQAIVDSYPKVFKKEGDGGKGGSNYGWGGVLLTVAESGPMGTLGEVSDQHYSNVLTYLSMKADEAEEAKRRADDAKRKRR